MKILKIFYKVLDKVFNKRYISADILRVFIKSFRMIHNQKRGRK